MIYLDNAATTMPKPLCVVEAVANALAICGNPARGAHGASLAAMRIVMKARSRLAGLFGVSDPARVIFCQSATMALSTAIGGIEGHILTTAAEHNSVLRPLHRRGSYSVVPLDSHGCLDLNLMEAAFRPDTRAVVMTHASNLTGNVFDIAAVSRLCAARGARLIVDAAQTAGLLPISVEELGISALCFSGHKSLYGPQGTGGLCLGPDYLPPPLMVGGSGSESFSREHPSILPDALEAGTPNTPGIAGLLAGVEYIGGKGEETIYKRADMLARLFAADAQRIGSVVLYGDMDAAVRTPVVALNLNGMGSAELASALEERYNIAVRAGAHCAPLMHQSLGTGDTGAVRFSFSHFNTLEEVDAAVAALAELSGEAQQ